MAQNRESKVAVGVFDDRQVAERAIERLRNAGFRDEEVGFLHHGDDASRAIDPAKVEPETKEAATSGAVAGGITGGVVGALLAGLVPGIGPVLAGGILAGVIGGATLGAAGGVVRTLLDLGVPEEESRLYEQQFAAGRSILAVKSDGRHEDAIHTLRQAGASFVRLENSPDVAEEFKPGNPAVVPESGAPVEAKDGTASSTEVAMSGEGTGYTPEDEEPALVFGRERATAPGRHADHWIDAEPVLRHDWESEHPETPWETVADLVRQGWEGANAGSRRYVGLSDSSSNPPVTRDRAA